MLGNNLMSYFQFRSCSLLILRTSTKYSCRIILPPRKTIKPGKNNNLTKQLVECLWEPSLGRKDMRVQEHREKRKNIHISVS